MQEPILTFKHYCAKTDTLTDICQLRLQYFAPEQTHDLWEHKPNKRGDHLYFKIGEKNEREDRTKVLFGVNGYVYSFVKVYARTEEHDSLDHVVASFSGYGDCTEFLVIMDLAQYTKNKNNQHKPIVDDYDLLMQKFKEISTLRKEDGK